MKKSNKLIIAIVLLLLIGFFIFQLRYYSQIVLSSTKQTLLQSELIKKDIQQAEKALEIAGKTIVSSGDIILISTSSGVGLSYSGDVVMYGVQSHNYLYRLPLYNEWVSGHLGGQSRVVTSVFSNLARHLYKTFISEELYACSSLSFIGSKSIGDNLFDVENINISIPEGMLNEVRLSLSGHSFGCSGDRCTSLENRVNRLYHMSNIILDRALSETNNPLLYYSHEYKNFSGYVVPFNDPQTSPRTSFIIIKSLQNGVVVNYQLLDKDPISLEQKRSQLDKFIKLVSP